MHLLHIGRSSKNDIVISDPTVSSHHAQLLVDENGIITLIDLDSTNGTFVNGKRVSGQRMLSKHDRVRLGNHEWNWLPTIPQRKAHKVEAIPQPPVERIQPIVQPIVIQTAPPTPAPIRQIVEVAPQRKKSSGWGWSLGVLALVAIALYVLMNINGKSLAGVVHIPETYDLSLNCPRQADILYSFAVTNTGNRTHDNVSVRVSAYDKRGDLLVEKRVSYEWSLEPGQTLPKVVTLPLKAVTCQCEIINSDPR